MASPRRRTPHNEELVITVTQLEERVKNIQSVQTEMLAEQKAQRKILYGNGDKGICSQIEENTRQIEEVVKWKEESENSKKETTKENKKYVWAIVIMSVTAILTTIGNVVEAIISSKASP